MITLTSQVHIHTRKINFKLLSFSIIQVKNKNRAAMRHKELDPWKGTISFNLLQLTKVLREGEGRRGEF